MIAICTSLYTALRQENVCSLRLIAAVLVKKKKDNALKPPRGHTSLIYFIGLHFCKYSFTRFASFFLSSILGRADSLY